MQYPASDPWVTSVGGTTLAIGPHGTYEWEAPWGDELAPLSADGKSWTDPPGNTRVIPGIAADADLATGMRYGHTIDTGTYAEFRGDGASQATPLIAGIQADAQQARHGAPIGVADPAIYARYNTSAFHDITQPVSPIAIVYQERDPGTGALTTGPGTPGERYLASYRLTPFA